MNPSTSGPFAVAAHPLSPSAMGWRSHPMLLGSVSYRPSVKGKRRRRYPTGIDVSKYLDTTALSAGGARRRCSVRVGSSAVESLQSWEPSPVTVTGEVGSRVITNAACRGASRVSMDEAMLQTKSSAFVEGRRRCCPPSAWPRHGGIGLRESNAWVDTNIFSVRVTFGVHLHSCQVPVLCGYRCVFRYQWRLLV